MGIFKKGETDTQKAEREKDLKRNVQLTEHKEDLGELEKRLGTNYDKVSLTFFRNRVGELICAVFALPYPDPNAHTTIDP